MKDKNTINKKKKKSIRERTLERESGDRMKGGKRKNSRLPSEAAGAGSFSRDIRESDLDGEASEHQERDETPEDAGSEGEEEPVAGDEEEEKDEDGEEKTYEESEERQIEEGDGDGKVKNVKPKLAEGFYEIETVRRKRTRKVSF